MGITFPTTGQSNWEIPLNDALGDMAAGGFLPNDHGLLTWAYDVAQVSGSAVFGTGFVKMVRLAPLPRAETISTLWVHINVAPVGLTAGESLLGLYGSDGTKLAETADLSASFATTGVKSGALTVPYAAVAGTTYYVVILANAVTTTPSFGVSASPSVAAVNANLSTATSRFALSGGGLTALPANITMGTITPSNTTTWCAVS